MENHREILDRIQREIERNANEAKESLRPKTPESKVPGSAPAVESSPPPPPQPPGRPQPLGPPPGFSPLYWLVLLPLSFAFFLYVGKHLSHDQQLNAMYIALGFGLGSLVTWLFCRR